MIGNEDEGVEAAGACYLCPVKDALQAKAWAFMKAICELDALQGEAWAFMKAICTLWN